MTIIILREKQPFEALNPFVMILQFSINVILLLDGRNIFVLSDNIKFIPRYHARAIE